jgi:hypothetical protein
MFTGISIVVVRVDDRGEAMQAATASAGHGVTPYQGVHHAVVGSAAPAGAGRVGPYPGRRPEDRRRNRAAAGAVMTR